MIGRTELSFREDVAMLEGLATVLLMLAQASSSGAQSGTASHNKGTTGGDPDQMICRAAEPVLGSRIARRRICRTRAQWQAFEADRQQLRRDLQNAGSCGGASSCASE
jgi:hypothetical protein